VHHVGLTVLLNYDARSTKHETTCFLYNFVTENNLPNDDKKFFGAAEGRERTVRTVTGTVCTVSPGVGKP
jgi:hypothetical protein